MEKVSNKKTGLKDKAVSKTTEIILNSHEISNFSTSELIQKLSDELFTLETQVKITNNFNQHIKLGTSISLLTFLACSNASIFETLLKKCKIELHKHEAKLLVLVAQPNNLNLLIKAGLSIDEQVLDEVVVTLILSADISRLLAINRLEIVTTEKIVATLRIPDLLINTLNIMYNKIGGLSRQYKLTDDDLYLKSICELEKRYINVFRLIRSNGIELNQLCNTSILLQNVFNSYLFYLIKYLLETTNESDYSDVIFYHYSNFPVENKIVMSPIYNDRNFLRIQTLLRDNMFIKRIVKKKLGKKIIKLNNITKANNTTEPIILLDE